MKDKFLPYKLIGDATYPMWPWFYFPFQNEKDGLPRYKTHLNFIQFNTKMSMERTFGMLKGKFKIPIKKNRHSIMPHARLGHNLHMFAQHVHC
jgi:hypothetical protein